MIEIEGKFVYSELDEIIQPSHTALILVDVQRDFVDPDGAFGSLGVDLAAYGPLRLRLAELLDRARQAGVMIIHIQMTTLPDRRSDSPAQMRFNMRMHQNLHEGEPPLKYTVIGTPGHDFLPEFVPKDDEYVVQKARSSAFWGTNLAQILRSNAIESVVVTGLTTEGCVESTARDAMFNDLYVVIPEDCVASDDPRQHEASLLLMRNRFDVVAAHDIERVWEAVSAISAKARDDELENGKGTEA